MSTDYPVTMAIRVLRQQRVEFTPHLYKWEPRGGTSASSTHLGVDEHAVVKTLIFEDEARKVIRPQCAQCDRVSVHVDRETLDAAREAASAGDVARM